MTDAEELSELHEQFVAASTNYVSAAQDTRAAAAKMQGRADAEQLGDWQNKLSREEELYVLSDFWLSEPAGRSLGNNEKATDLRTKSALPGTELKLH